MYFTARTG